MCISDWSSDVCSSDLCVERAAVFRHHLVAALHRPVAGAERASGHIIISAAGFDHRLLADHALALHLVEDAVAVADQPMAREKLDLRSEEHTSELQSLMRISYAVFCLQKNNTTQ